MNIPGEIQQFCSEQFGTLISFQAASGGCINNGGKLTTSSEAVFIKWNSATRYPKMFSKEKLGLELLHKAEGLTIPEVRAVYEGELYSCIVMEFIESAIKVPAYWEQLGHGLAAVHSTSSTKYGLDHDNYMGSLEQYNDTCTDWLDFFIRSRLGPQIKLARDHNRMGKEPVQLFERLYTRLPDLLVTEPPALIHGDLWSGNIMTDSQGMPALIDPAVSFANREMDIAMTQLFGRLPAEFYDVYNNAFPMSPGWQERLDIYNLYPLLVHVNLFGGGYLSQTMHIVRRFI